MGERPACINDLAMEAASRGFIERGGGVDRWLLIMTSSGEDIDAMATIWCNASTREPGESDRDMRLKAFLGWREAF